MDEIGPVERGTQHGCVCDFAAVSASHAGIVDVGDGVFLEGVAAVLDGERWATRKPYAGMVAGTDVGVDTKPLLHNALAFFDGSPELRLDPALLVQHALGLRNNDLGTFLGRSQCLFDGGLHLRHTIGTVKHAHPFHAYSLYCIHNGIVGRAVFVFSSGRQDILSARGGRVVVVDDDDDAVVLVEDGVTNT